jgi:hypothetical protein
MRELIHARQRQSFIAAIGVAAAFAIVAAIAAACGGSATSASCNAGDVKSCTCSDGTGGTEACESSGSYGACTCGDGGSDAGDAGTGSDSPTGDGALDCSGEGGLAFMCPCMQVGTPGDCSPVDMGECFNYPNRGSHCTRPCTTDQECPPPSGACNGMGVCKAPNATGEAGAD